MDVSKLLDKPEIGLDYVNKLPRFKLEDAYQRCKRIEKTTGKKKVIYFAWENDKCIYIGIGGTGTNESSRNGSGRLYEHKRSTWTNFRSDYERLKGEEDHSYTIYQRNLDWNNIKWSFICYNDINSVETIEKLLLNIFRPRYNKDIPQLDTTVINEYSNLVRLNDHHNETKFW